MTCKCFEFAKTEDLINELEDRGISVHQTIDTDEAIEHLLNQGYYVDKTQNLLGNMDAGELIEELEGRGYVVDKIGYTWQLYFDAISNMTPATFQQKLSYFFEKTINKRL